MTSFPSRIASQAQPDPKRVVPAAANFVLNSAKEPKRLVDRRLLLSQSARQPTPFFISDQNIV
jgi:hypothetical protein